MKNKKTAIIIAAAVFVLAAAMIIWIAASGKKAPQTVDEPTGTSETGKPAAGSDPTEPTVTDDPAATDDPDATPGPDTTGSPASTEDPEGATAIDDGGDIIITIPDDQGSGGL